MEAASFFGKSAVNTGHHQRAITNEPTRTRGSFVSVRTAWSREPGAKEVAQEIRASLAEAEPLVVLYFASGSRDAKALAEAMFLAFPGAIVAGCTTAGERVGALWQRDSVVAMGLSDDVLHSATPILLEHLVDKPDLKDALAKFEAERSLSLSSLDPSRYVGLLLVDGLCMAEEALMDRLGDLTDMPIVGGSAGDDLTFRSTWIMSAGRPYQGAALLLLLEPRVPFRVLKTQSFRPLPQTMQVTRADETKRLVFEFDGKPAASRYAEVLGIDVTTLPSHFMRHPLGLMVGDEPYVRSPQQLHGESISFYCKVIEGQTLQVLESADIVLDTGEALRQAASEIGGAGALISFDCVLRTAEIEREGLMDSYGALFADTPTIGFSTYGELFVGHVNQTATMLLLGRVS